MGVWVSAQSHISEFQPPAPCRDKPSLSWVSHWVETRWSLCYKVTRAQLHLGLKAHKAHPLPCVRCSVFLCRGGRAPQAFWQSCERGNFDRPLCLPWIIPVEGKLIKVQVSREEEEGKQKRAVEPQIDICSTTGWQGHGVEQGQGTCLICAAAVGTRLPQPSPAPASLADSGFYQITPCVLKWTTPGCPVRNDHQTLVTLPCSQPPFMAQFLCRLFFGGEKEPHSYFITSNWELTAFFRTPFYIL